MSYLHNPSWAWHVQYPEYRAYCHIKHRNREQLDRDHRGFNPLDDSTLQLVAVLYAYAKEHDFVSAATVSDMFAHAAGLLSPLLHFDITADDVANRFDELKEEFYYFREFLEFPGIRLEDDKKHVHVEREYFTDLGGEPECWLYKSFRLFGLSYYKEMQFIVIKKRVGGPPEFCTSKDWYYIKGRNSDVGEEVIDVWDEIIYDGGMPFLIR